MSSEFISSGNSAYLFLEPNVNAAIETRMGEISEALAELNQKVNEGSDMSEVEMMQFNVLVSRFNTLITLASGIYKNLTDGEKTIAQKM